MKKFNITVLLTAAVLVFEGVSAWGANDAVGETLIITLDIAEERIPEAPKLPDIAPEDYIDPIDPAAFATEDHTADEVWLPAEDYIEAPAITVTIRESPPAGYNTPPEFSLFPFPMISSPEAGMWYVQIGAFSQPELVESEINRIGTGYPIAVQNTGTDTDPVFRVLLGPLNQGESGAMLQRFKSIGYKDAFMRRY